MTTLSFGISRIASPQSLLPYQTRLVDPPLIEAAAGGQNPLATLQRSIVIGEPVPIVFARRVSNVGGVFVTPGATEGRYQNNASTNVLTVNLQIVLSEGDMPQLEERDLYQRNCRVGTWVQTYNRRAGSFLPGNFIVAVATRPFWNCPLFCGTSGTYADMTTLSYTNTHNDNDDSWDKQVHAFVREGIQVTRVLDEVYGSSNNVIDLALYLIQQSSRFPDAMIDDTGMLEAANFTNVNGFFYNGVFKDSTNLEDWLESISVHFLLRFGDRNGKKGLRPRLPINEDYTIKITAVDWDFTFGENHILPDTFEIEYISLADRKPITALILWRQQPDSEPGIIRTAEIQMENEAINGPFEQYDLSVFCVSENHAVKIGAYYVARRKYITHTLRIAVKPDTYNSTLAIGDIVRVQLRRETIAGEVGFHDYLYEVERISKMMSGVVELDLMHFPIDDQGRSLVALAVDDITAIGTLLPTGRSDFSCNVNNNTSKAPNSGGNLPDLPSLPPYEVPAGNEGQPGDGPDNPPEPPAPQPTISGGTGPDGTEPSDEPLPGDELELGEICDGMFIEWWLCPDDGSINISGACEKVAQGVAEPYIVDGGASGKRVFGIGRCPDPGSPDGYGPPNVSAPTPVVPEGDVKTGALGTYNLSWRKFSQLSCVGSGCDGKTNVRPAEGITSCDDGSPVTGVNYYDATGAVVTASFSNVYGLRAYSVTATITLICFSETPSSQTIPIIKVQSLTSLGVWIDVVYAPAAALAPDGTSYGTFDETGEFNSSKAISIAITGP